MAPRSRVIMVDSIVNIANSPDVKVISLNFLFLDKIAVYLLDVVYYCCVCFHQGRILVSF